MENDSSTKILVVLWEFWWILYILLSSSVWLSGFVWLDGVQEVEEQFDDDSAYEEDVIEVEYVIYMLNIATDLSKLCINKVKCIYCIFIQYIFVVLLWSYAQWSAAITIDSESGEK